MPGSRSPGPLSDASVFRGLIGPAIEARPEFHIGRARSLYRIDKHAVMPVPDFVDRVTDRIKEILVCRQDGAIHAKLDDRLRLANSRHLAVAISGQQLLLGHVGREFPQP